MQSTHAEHTHTYIHTLTLFSIWLCDIDRLAITNARRLRAASDAASHAKSETRSEGSVESLSDEELARTDEPFIIVSQELFLEHQSGITHAKFSCEGSLISSCDAENIVRIWSYNGSSTMPPAKIANTNNILSLAWETRDRYVCLIMHATFCVFFVTTVQGAVLCT